MVNPAKIRSKELWPGFDEQGKMPDVVVYYTAKNWLVLIEAVTSHGPVNAKRQRELKGFSRNPRRVRCDRVPYSRRYKEVSWRNNMGDICLGKAPSHMIHFNGERFLGP